MKRKTIRCGYKRPALKKTNTGATCRNSWYTSIHLKQLESGQKTFN